MLVVATPVLLALLAKTPVARRFSKAAEAGILELIPGYRQESQKLRAKLEAAVASYKADKE